jgi:hypothetical protein
MSVVNLVRSFVLLVLWVGTANAQRVWVQQGPGPNTLGQVEAITDREVAGAVHAVAAHPSDPDILFIGAVNGGIWRTNDATTAGPTWVPQLGLDQSLSIGAIAFDPTDATAQTLMAGAGRFSSFSARGNDRVGAWRTTDGGTNWTLLTGGGTIAGLNVSGVAPRGATLVLAANAADVFASRGVWRSTTTGTTWTQISGAPGTGLPTGAAFDLTSDPSNNARLFTNAGTSGIYRSDDTGATWTKVSNATVDAALVGANNVEIAVGTSNNVYVAIVTGGSLSALFRSPDGGGTWAALDVPGTTESGVVVGIHPGGQGGTHLSIAADPTNANVVYVGGDRQPFLTEFTTGVCPCFPNSIGANDFSGRLFRVDASLAAGTQATHITNTNTAGGSSPHADSRDMAFDANGDLLEVDDGGIYRRTAPLTNTGDWFSIIGDLKVTELHDAAWDAVSKVAIGGAQDTGTPEQRSAGNMRWRSVSTADGGDVAVDDFGTPGVSIRYSSNQRIGSFLRRTVDAANTVTATVFPALTVIGGGAALTTTFKTPFAINNVTPTRLIIAGGNSVYESLDQGGTITEIGPGIAVNASNRDPIAYGGAGNADMLYVGSGDQVFVRNAPAPAALTASATYPGTGTGRIVADIVIDRGNAQVAYVIDATNVYRTPDGGATWGNITGDLATQTPGAFLSIAYSTSNTDGSVIIGANNGAFIARGPAFTTWTPVGAGLPRAPVSDLEYDPTDEILVAGLLGRGTWTVNLDERDPVDVALVLDLSGSMLSPACTGCDPKLQVLKDAVELFVQLWTVLTIPDDRLGVNYFRTDIDELLIGGSALFPAIPNATTVIADVQSQTTVGANLTAMGGGLQAALNRLTDTSRPRNVILFTDGMQNVNPMVDATTFVIDNVSGKPNSNISPTSPATDLNTALGIKVNTIGVGATPAFVDLLDDIASETNGLFKLTTAPDDDLRRFYVEELVDVLRTFSPQLVDYRYGTVRGDTASETFRTNGSARQVVLKLSWKRGSPLRFSVLKDGVDVTRFGRIITGPFYQIYTIDVPGTYQGTPVTAAGAWRMRISGGDGRAYEAAAIVNEEELEYAVAIAGKNHLAGAPLELTAQIAFGGQPVTDARLTARILAPKQGLGTLLATTSTPAAPAGFQYETGATAAQRKYQLLLGVQSFQMELQPSTSTIELQSNGNGTYSATFTNTAAAGPYTVIFRLEGSRPDVGSYERTEVRSATLTFATPSRDASSIRAELVRLEGAGRRYDLIVRPVDALGNYLGPDYGHAIAVRVDGVSITAEPADRLDGSYVFPFVASTPPGVTNVIVTVLGRPLYDGPLADIAQGRPSRAHAFLLSAHGGVAIPSSGFGAGADPGLLLEADLEYRITPIWAVEAVVGRYDFGSMAGSLVGGALYAKAYRAMGTWYPYAAGGVGVYDPEHADAGFGLSAVVGANRSLSGALELDVGAGYTHVFRAGGLGFAHVKAGAKLVF